MSKPDVIWVPVSEFAKEYNKASWTIVRWIREGFIFSLGVRVKRDVSGYWYIGKPVLPAPPPKQDPPEL